MVGTFLGTGASSGVPMLNCSCKVCTSSYSKNKRLRSSFFLESSSGIKLLIDTGPDIRQQLLREKIDRLDLVLYTHEHYDHIMGFDDIKFYTRCAPLNIYARDTAMAHIRNAFPYNFTSKPSLSGKADIIANVIRDFEPFFFLKV